MKLPLNCELEYLAKFLNGVEAEALYQDFMENGGIAESRLKLGVGSQTYFSDFGKIMVIDQDLYEANRFPSAVYGKVMTWPKPLMEVKERIEDLTGREFKVCVCIYYPDGSSGVDFHSDPAAYGDTTVIPSLSIGEERLFQIKEKETGEIHQLILENGSLIIMGEHCQERYEHCLPIDLKYKKGRINMTFRQYGFDS